MKLTQTQKLLIYGLRQFPIAEEEQEAIFLFLHDDESKMQQMIDYLAANLEATSEEIMNKAGEIITA